MKRAATSDRLHVATIGGLQHERLCIGRSHRLTMPICGRKQKELPDLQSTRFENFVRQESLIENRYSRKTARAVRPGSFEGVMPFISRLASHRAIASKGSLDLSICYRCGVSLRGAASPCLKIHPPNILGEARQGNTHRENPKMRQCALLGAA